MFNKKYEILCKLNLSQNNITVNDVIRAVNYELRNVAVEIIGSTINNIQDEILCRFLGNRWNEFENKIVPWICPHCHERSSFVRRGRRSRKLKTSEGVINFSLYQVTCKSCSKTFSPFPQLLGLKPRTRISTEFEEKIVKLALDNSYDKTSKYIEKFTGTTISHTASRNIVLRVSDNISINHDISKFDSILIDGTKVKSGSKERGSELHLALAPLKRIDKQGRPYNEKAILAFSIGKADKNFKRQVAHLLYMHKVPVKDREVFLYSLIGILKNKDFYKAISEYFDFIKMFERLQFHDIVCFLKKAMSGIFHNNEDWNNNKRHSSNSLIEREMREINRRTDVGCRWSDEGVYKIIKLLEIKRHASHNFDQYFKQNRRGCRISDN